MSVFRRHGEEEMPAGTPWLMDVTLHSSREYECSLPTAEQCVYQQGYWRFWYRADQRYALPTVAFFLSAIAIFTIAHVVPWPRKLPLMQRGIAINRYLSYRSFRLAGLNWNSAPAGVLLLGLIGFIYFLCMSLGPQPYYWPTNASWGDSPPLATRSGWLSIACLPFVIATAGKSNLITLVTGVSHEKLQVFHRWISYAMYVTALVHTFPFIVFNISKGMMVMNWDTSVYYWTGVVALLAQTWLTFASFGPFRNMAYETFKFCHFLAGLVFVLFFFFHCGFTLTSADYFIATAVIFVLHWSHRQIKIYVEHGLGLKATISLMSNGFVKVSVPTQSTWAAGQHYFVRFLSLKHHAFATHPFTACSLPVRQSYGQDAKSEVVFYIRPQGGFTSALAKQAEAHAHSQVRVTLDGPYGGVPMSKIAESTRMLVLAGGSGAGWMLPMLIAHLRKVERLSKEDTESLRMVLATRDMPTRHWFDEAVAATLSSFGLAALPSGIEVEVHYTGDGDQEEANAPGAAGQFLRKLDDPEKAPLEHPIAETASSSGSDLSTAHVSRVKATIDGQVHHGRPNLSALVTAEASAASSDRPLGVFVCGPLSMQNDVSNAAAHAQLGALRKANDVYLHMEHFSWA